MSARDLKAKINIIAMRPSTLLVASENLQLVYFFGFN